MSKKTSEKQGHEAGHEPLWVGVDWGTCQHAVTVVDDKRAIVCQFKTGTSLQELKSLAQRLHSLGDVTGVAIESNNTPVVHALVEQDFTIFPINPKLSKNWREGFSVAGSKNDERDGLVLAVELARRHESLRTLKELDSKVAEMAGLCEALRGFIAQRTACVQRLKAALAAYFPAGLELFRDWTSPVAWRFIKKFPTAEKFARAHKKTIIAFLRANHVGLRPNVLKCIEERTEATAWPKPPNARALQLTAELCVAQLLTLQSHIDHCDRLIAERREQLPHTELVGSLPGAGERLTPPLTAMVAEMADEPDPHQALRCLSGAAPIQYQSGKRCQTKIRRRCNKHWRNVLHMFAMCSMAHCNWARAFYELRRASGDRHATALRKLADKWLKILVSMIRKQEPYDEAKYLARLKKNNSPVYAKLCEQPGG
jgi:transposase